MNFSFVESNEGSLIGFQPFQDLIVDAPLRIYQGIVSIFTLLFGNIFYWGIVHYERYGGDPLKRSIQNQLISAIAIAGLMICYISNVTLTWRIQVGPLNEDVAMFVLVLNHFFFMLMMFNLTELMVFKVILCCFDTVKSGKQCRVI